MELGDFSLEGFEGVDGALLDFVDDVGDEGVGGDEACHVEPCAFAFVAGGGEVVEEVANDLLVGGVGVADGGEGLFEVADEGVAEKFVDADAVELNAALEGATGDGGALVGVGVAGGSGEFLKLLEYGEAVDHLVDGVGAEEVVVDLVETLLGVALVALGPFLGVAYGADGAEVDAGDDVGLAVFLDEVGEGHLGGVGVFGVTPHDEGEGSDAGRPQDVGV